MKNPPCFALEHDPGGFRVLHVFRSVEDRTAWLAEMDGLSLASPGGRGYVTDRQIEVFTGPVINH